MNTKFYTFSQNNSGGYFIENEYNGVCEFIIIEARDADNANEILDSIGEKVDGFFEYCSCCGERWSYVDESDGTKEPMIYNTPIDQCYKELFRNNVFVHYLDGTVKKFELKDK